ncbi:MAG: hypothetical protein IKH25_04475 [Muribaculaceae bacterium]|nr:hypothetical protein [Muribaculaceae bacterium]
MKKLFSLLTLALLTMSAVAGNYVKVTSTADLTSGKYLIVYEDGNVAFNGALNSLDVASNTVAVTIENGVIAPKDAIIAAQFDIDVTAGTIKSASGYYIGQTSDANGMLTSTETAYTNTISITTDGNADIKSSGNAYLRYNAASNQARFRYYKSSSYTGQKAIQLYKWDGEEDPVMGLVPPVFTPNGGKFTGSIEVSLTCATPNAEIQYYECDPTTHEIDWTTYKYYTQPFYVNETKSFVAYSSKSNEVSEYVYADFIKETPQCAKPKFTPANGATFMQGEELDVTISCATEGATILYTVNDEVYEGTAPVVVTLTESATITAVASAEGYTDSEEASASYTMVVPEATGHIFNLVTDVTTLAAGDHIILVNATEDGAAVAMGAAKSNNFGSVDVVVNGNKVQTEKANIITLEKNGDNWNLKAAEGYLYAASSSSNHLKAEAAVDNNGNANAAISIADNAASIVFQGTNSHNNLRYNPNNGSPIFSCYEAGKQNPVYIYKTDEEIITVAAPTFDPAACEFEESIDVTINFAEGATLHYMVGDGDEQTATAPVTVTLTETTTITAYAELNGVESEIVEATYTLKEAAEAITTLAEARALEDNTEFTFGGNVVVVYKNGSNLWVKDETASGLIYGSGLTNFEQGTVLNSGWSGQKVMYQEIIPEFQNPQNVTASEQEKVTVEPTVVELSAIDATKMNDYIRINDVTIDSISSTDNRNYYANGMVLRNQFGGITLEVGKTYSLIGLVTAYKGVPQVYITEVVNAPEPTVVDVNNIAEAVALESGKQFAMYNDVVVTYHNGKRLFIRDTEGNSGMIYDTKSAIEGTFENGQVLSDGWTATYEVYNGLPEFTNPDGVEAAGTETREAAPYERTTITDANVNEYVIMKGLTILPDATNAKNFYNAADSLLLYDQFGVQPEIEEGKTYDVVGAVTIYKNNVQLYIISVTEAAAAGLRGDVNNDGDVNIGDVTTLIDYLLNPATEINAANADVTLEGDINIGDVTALIDYLLSNTWPE